jgi:radical SAM protein with 4Fe4S-binding SPASM domain
MLRTRFDFENRYLVTFDDRTGEYIRSSVYSIEGNLTPKEPFMADYPHLLDIGIMGHCEHGISGYCQNTGTYCYQNGESLIKANMTLKNYTSLMKQCSGKVFQVALGGRGDADCHPDFEAILEVSRHYGIVPNITSSGYRFTREKAKLVKKYCGAAAISWYETPYTLSAIKYLLDEKVTTNIHYILSEASIKRAVELIKRNLFPNGIAAVVFLLYKPVGHDKFELVLKPDNPYLDEFFSLMNKNEENYKFGFDSCLAPGVLLNCDQVSRTCIEPCESGRFSGYIDSEMNFYPCSFVQSEELVGDLNQESIESVWKGPSFKSFREKQKNRCLGCSDREDCLGGCPHMESINLCTRLERG